MWTNGIVFVVVTLYLHCDDSSLTSVLPSNNEQQTFSHAKTSITLNPATRTIHRSMHRSKHKNISELFRKIVDHDYHHYANTQHSLIPKRKNRRKHYSKVKHEGETPTKEIQKIIKPLISHKSDQDKKPKLDKSHAGNKEKKKKTERKVEKVQLTKNGDSKEEPVDKLLEDKSTEELLHDQSKHSSKGQRLSRKTLRLLREALLQHPFSTWKFNSRFQSMSDLGIEESQLHEFVDNKWNVRMKEKLTKVLNGEDINLDIIGGSNAAGGGIQEDEGDTSGAFYRVISDWWKKTISPITGSHLKLRPISMGGTGSDFFQYCYANYIQDDVDIVFLELSVNDLKQLPPNVNLSLPIEQLTRQLLLYPTHPALLYLNLFSGRTYYQGCVNLEDFGQNLLSDAYQVTTFSWRDAVCPKTAGNFRVPLKSCGVVCTDGHHINLRGHAHISLMIINLFRDILLNGIARKRMRLTGFFEDKNDLPVPVFITSPNKIIDSPKCWTTLSPNSANFKIKNSLQVGVMENFGFDYDHNTLIGAPCNAPKFCRSDTYSGWTGKDVGASLVLSFTVPALPRGHSRRKGRSVVFATRTCFKCGGAEVWLDEDIMNRKYILAKSSYSQTLLEIIQFHVEPGDHTMKVKVVVPGDFTAVGVMVGPADGPY